MILNLTINGEKKQIQIKPADLLIDVLRKEGCFSVKKGCGTGDCGACSILVDGRLTRSCIMLAAQAEGKSVTTVEGISEGPEMHTVQEVFMRMNIEQCGFCMPGVVLAVKALLDENPAPTDDDIKNYLDGNLCRCTGYIRWMDAIREAAKISAGRRK